MIIHRIHIIFVACFVLLSGTSLTAQEQRVTIHAEDVAMREVMDAIEEQTGWIFSYSSRLIDDQKKISIHLDQVPLEAGLASLFEDQPVRFELMEKQIVLKRMRRRDLQVVPSEAPGKPNLKYTISGYVTDVASGEVLI